MAVKEWRKRSASGCSNVGLRNHYPADKNYGNQLRYPLDKDLSG